LHEIAGCSARQRGPEQPEFRTPLPVVTSADLNIDRKCLIDSNFFVAPSAGCVPTKTQRSISFSFESAEELRAAFHQFGADARHIAIITFPVQRLPFDNGPNQRIDSGIPRQRVVAR
jgi:hypothetical protein